MLLGVSRMLMFGYGVAGAWLCFPIKNCNNIALESPVFWLAAKDTGVRNERTWLRAPANDAD